MCRARKKLHDENVFHRVMADAEIFKYYNNNMIQ